MSAVKKGEVEGEAQNHRIRVTLNSQNTENIEKGESYRCAVPLPFALASHSS